MNDQTQTRARVKQRIEKYRQPANAARIGYREKRRAQQQDRNPVRICGAS